MIKLSRILVSNQIRMQVHLPQNKRLRALKAVNDLQKAHTVTHVSLEEILSFLLHCCIIVPLGQSFLRELYSLLHRLPSRNICISILSLNGI